LIVEPIKARYSGLRQYGFETVMISALTAILAGVSAWAATYTIIHR